MAEEKNLGQIAAVWIGNTAPTNKKLLWFDDRPAYKFFRYWDILASDWLQLHRNYDSAPTSGSGNLLTSGTIYTSLASLGLIQFTKVGHGFIVGDIVRYDDANGFVKALADTTENARMVGMVSRVVDADNFGIVVSGYVNDLQTELTPGDTYFLSDTVPGGLSLHPGNIVKPCVQTLTATSCIFVNGFGLDV